MKREYTFKSLLATATILSLFAFAFVNFRANTTSTQRFSAIELTQSKVEGEDESESNKFSVPNVSVLGRVWELAQRFLDKTN